MRILQIAPTIEPGTGVGAVAHHLEQEWRALGVEVDRFTLAEARGGWLPEPGPGWRGKVALAARVVWFSTVGTVLARRVASSVPDRLTVCHNDALAGDVYVNHGILQASMRARGAYSLRMLRNPMHVLIALRDRLRYHRPIHRVVVDLVAAEEVALRATFPRLVPPTVVIGNGVDVDRFCPPTPGERDDARAELGLTPDDVAVVFIGHEFDRKGLPLLLDALERTGPEVHLVVVGGTADMVESARGDAGRRGLGARVHLVGRHDDPRPFLHAGDLLGLPSAYESYGLVVLEALACGIPVIVTPVGCAPDVVTDGETGYVVARDPEAFATAIRAVAEREREAPGSFASACRARAEANSWRAVAGRYLELLATLATSDRAPGATAAGAAEPGLAGQDHR